MKAHTHIYIYVSFGAGWRFHRRKVHSYDRQLGRLGVVLCRCPVVSGKQMAVDYGNTYGTCWQIMGIWKNYGMMKPILVQRPQKDKWHIWTWIWIMATNCQHIFVFSLEIQLETSYALRRVDLRQLYLKLHFKGWSAVGMLDKNGNAWRKPKIRKPASLG